MQQCPPKPFGDTIIFHPTRNYPNRRSPRGAPCPVDPAMASIWMAPGVLLAFDGEIIELFGALNSSVNRLNPSLRWHASAVELVIGKPDRKGNRNIEFRVPQTSGMLPVQVADDDWPRVEAILGEIATAVSAAQRPR